MTKPLPPSFVGCSRTNIQDVMYAYLSQKYAMPPKESITWKWTGFEHELEIRITPNGHQNQR